MNKHFMNSHYYSGKCIPVEINAQITFASLKLTASEIELAKKIMNEMASLVLKADIEVHSKLYDKYGSFGMELVERYIKS